MATKKIKNENYFSVLGWMRNEHELSGNELMLYAILYGFSQDGESQYAGSIPYLVDWLGVNKTTIHRSLNSLMEKGLVQRIIDAPDHSCYRAFRHPKKVPTNNPKELQNATGGELQNETGVSQNATGSLQNATGGVAKCNSDIKEDNSSVFLSIERGGKAPKGPPSYEEVVEYIREHHPGVSPEKFYSYYEARDWHLGGGQKVKNWKALARNWASREGDYNRKKSAAYTTGLVPSRPKTPEEEAQDAREREESLRQMTEMLENWS